MQGIDPTIQAIIDELRERIRVLEEENARLRKTVEEQARIIEEWKRGHRVRPRRGSKKKSAAEKKRPGRKPGHAGAQREMALDLRYDMRLSFHKISDFMGAYRTCAWMIHQYCWVHLLRDADKALEMRPDERIQKFSDSLHAIYADALLAQATGDQSKQQEIHMRLDHLVADPKLSAHPDVKRLQTRADVEFYGLLTFMNDPRIPAHNNGGELAARALVMMRKIIGGTRSERGTDVHAHFMSTSQTAHKQGIDHGNFIIEVLAAKRQGKPPPSIFQS